MTLRIRKATPNDYAALVEVLWECDQLHIDHLPQVFQTPLGSRPETIRTREYITGLLHDPGASILLAEEPDTTGAPNVVLGAIITILHDTPPIPLLVPRRYATIDVISVRQDQRGKGIGQQLMHTAEDWAHSMGARDMELNVFLFNQNAVHFYEELGYSAVSQKMSRKL